MRLTKDNINKTLFNKKWKNLKTLIESFILISFQSIEINIKSIYFVEFTGLSYKKSNYTLRKGKSSLSLVDIINQDKLLILNDKNIIIKNLFICDNYIKIELTSKIIFN